jgi:hypothetical protein
VGTREYFWLHCRWRRRRNAVWQQSRGAGLKSVTSTRGLKPAAIKLLGQSAIGGHWDLIELAACTREELGQQSVGSGRVIDTQAEPRQVFCN